MKNIKQVVVTFLPLGLMCVNGLAQEVAGPRTHYPNPGILIVYSATEETETGDNTYRYPHTPYKIFQDGKLVETVDNGHALINENPTPVKLPAGKYTVVADSETSGRVTIPVVIQAGLRTPLHLEHEKDWKPDETEAAQGKLTRLPNGQPIGYRN